MYSFIWESAGILKIDPRPFKFHQLLMMREGCENEYWDRLSYLIGVYLSSQGNKNVKINDFHKFKMAVKEERSMSKEELHSLKSYFEE